MLGGQAGNDLREDAPFVAALGQMAFSHSPPPLPTVVERLVRAMSRGGITPTQPIAVDENNPAQRARTIDA